MLKNIRHTGFVVTEIERALYFYINVLGFKLLNKGTVCAAEAYSLFNLDSDIDYYKLFLNKTSVIELYDIKNIKVKYNNFFRAGYLNHFAVTVDDIDHYYKLLLELKELVISDKISELDGHKLFFATDFDGNLIEFVQTPTEKE